MLVHRMKKNTELFLTIAKFRFSKYKKSFVIMLQEICVKM